MKNLFIALGIGLIIGFLSGWKIEGWRSDSKFAAFQSDLNTKTADALNKVQLKIQSDGEKVKLLTDKLNKANLQNEKLENDRNVAIAAGTKRVYVRASCTPTYNTATYAAPTGGSDGPTAELDPAYRQTLSDLRRGVEQQYQQIVALQTYAQSCATP